MIWANRSDHLVVDMTNLVEMPSLSTGYLRVLLLWFYIQRNLQKCDAMDNRGEDK